MKKRILQKTICLLIFTLMSPNIVRAAQFSVGGVTFRKDVKPLKEIKRKNVVTQSLDYSCGAAGLSTLLTYHFEHHIPEDVIIEHLLKIVPIEKVKARKGFSLYDLKKFTEMIGYRVTGYKMDMDFLKELDTPVLVPIKFKNFRHFVVVKRIVADRVFLADPAAGNVSMKVDKFNSIWLKGIGLVVEDPTKGKIQNTVLNDISKDDLVFSDYKRFNRLTAHNTLRTRIYPTEF